MAFKDIFKDENDFNEKTIIGFMSFAVMTMYSMTDLVTGYMGMELHYFRVFWHSWYRESNGWKGCQIEELKTVKENV